MIIGRRTWRRRRKSGKGGLGELKASAEGLKPPGEAATEGFKADSDEEGEKNGPSKHENGENQNPYNIIQ